MSSSSPDNTRITSTREANALLGSVFFALRDAESADQAASLLLAEVNRAVQDALQQGAATSPSVCRSVLHLAGENGASGVLVVEAERAGAPEGLLTTGPDLRSSRIALQHVKARGAAVILDVSSRRLEFEDGSIYKLQPEQVRAHTVQRLERNLVSHLLAMPLRRPDGRWLGMVCVELRHPQAAGRRLALHPLLRALVQPVLDLGGLFITQLPRARSSDGAARPPMGGTLTACYELALLMARRGEPACLLGPAGAGKEWLARHVGQRVAPTGPTEAIDAARLTETTLIGALASLDVLIIKHVEALSASVQARLARWLSGPRERACVLMLTSRRRSFELEKPDALHADLWRELSPYTVWLGPLAERAEDIDGIARAVLAERAAARGVPPARLGDDALAILRATPIPENARGLRNLMQRALLEADARQPAGGPVTVEASDLTRAIEATRPPAAGGLLEQLRPGLRLLVDRAPGAGLALRDLDGLAGAVVAEALEQEADTFAVARRFGYRRERRGGNHLKLLRPPADRLRALCERLGEPTPPALDLLEQSSADRRKRGN